MLRQALRRILLSPKPPLFRRALSYSCLVQFSHTLAISAWLTFRYYLPFLLRNRRDRAVGYARRAITCGGLRERKGKEWQIDAKICTSGALMMAKSRAYCDSVSYTHLTLPTNR